MMKSSMSKWLIASTILLLAFYGKTGLMGQVSMEVLTKTSVVRPLDQIRVFCPVKGELVIRDSKDRIYSRQPASGNVLVTVAGATGWQRAVLINKRGVPVDSISFLVEASTRIDDGGKISAMFKLFHDGMLVYNPKGYDEVWWKGRPYRFFVEWVLDNNNTTRGMKYFSPYSGDMIDLFRQVQREDGMIWSFVRDGTSDDSYFETAYSSINFFRKYPDAWFVRQPVENHPEYNFVNLMYQHWKVSGDDAWMKRNLECASRALDYCITDSIRWSKRFKLLKRPYCIDSWDFQVNDEYLPQTPVSPSMVVVPGKTKYGVFFGDNTGYIEACNQLAEMLHAAGNPDKAKTYAERSAAILENLTALAWNGRFFTHFVDEDPAVKRDLGVDEKSQIAQGNMYSVNRGLPHEMNVAIIKTYLDLKGNLPPGSPGEWYSIYPPFERGFGGHNEKWQYMNGGIAGHAAGELARGAYENGYEWYASDILTRLTRLCQRSGNRVWFAFTGSFPPPPPPIRFRPLDLSAFTNMDIWDKGAPGVFRWMNDPRPGNDMRNLPVGRQDFGSTTFSITDPDKNGRKAAIGLSVNPGFQKEKEIPVHDTASAIYILHSFSEIPAGKVTGSMTIEYEDGTFHSWYIHKEEDITNWWFPGLKTSRSGVAWDGPNPVCSRVGVCWASFSNPKPAVKISKLIFRPVLTGGIYAVLAVSLGDRMPYVKPSVESFGGPDNWAAANAMGALVEGLAGVRDNGLAFSHPVISPRWTSMGTDSVDVIIHLPASNGYVAYRYIHLPVVKTIHLTVTGSGDDLAIHLLLPDGAKKVKSVLAGGKPMSFDISRMESSMYADFKLNLPVVKTIEIYYE